MGVKGLQTFIERECPHVKQKIYLPDLVQYHRLKYKVKPELVLDGMAVIRILYCSNNTDWVCGGQWIEYGWALKSFVDKFSSLDMSLTFIFDGCIDPAKRFEWVQRRVQKCNEIHQLFEWIKFNHRVPDNNKFQLPTSMGSLTALALRVLCPQVKVMYTFTDADCEISSYASKNEAVFGIVSNDTDFIIYDTKPYFSINDFDFDAMTTSAYNRRLLSEILSLPISQFPLLSCLMGNDFISRNDLKAFHHRISNSRNYQNTPLVYCIADIISYNGWTGNPDNYGELYKISETISNDTSLLDILHKALSMYSRIEVSPDSYKDLIALRHGGAAICPAIYNIYNQHVYESSNVMEDISESMICPVSIFYRPLRRRIYSILLESHGHRGCDKHQVPIDEWCAFYSNKMERPYKAYPEHLPELDDGKFDVVKLWLEGTEAEKLKYFAICLNIHLKERELQNVNPNFAVFCCVLNYILCCNDSPCLYEWEVKAFVAQAVFIQDKSPQDIASIQVRYIDTRAISLASLFMRGVSILILALGACGYPFSLKNAMPWNFFDGKVFHLMYTEAKQSLSGAFLYQREPSKELFEKLYEYATFGIEFPSS